MKELLKKWDIGSIDTISPTPTGERAWFVKTTAKREFVLKKSDLIRSERHYGVLLALSKTQMPVALPIATTEGDWYAKDQGELIHCLYPRLPGQVATEHYGGDAEKRALGFGQAIGLLHTCFRECADENGYRDIELLEQVEEWAIPRIREEGAMVDFCAIEQIWKDAESELKPLYNELPQHLIHRDAHPFNMLFSAGRLTGFLDFELVQRGPRVFDMCYCGGAILVEGFEDPEKAQKWPSLFRSLVRGYEEFCPLTASERLVLYGVIMATELIFLAFWMDRDDKDSARTCERLVYWLAANRDALAV